MNSYRWILVLLLFSMSASVFACSCIPRTFGERLDAADLVMVVRITSTRFDTIGAKAGPGSDGPVHAAFDVIETLKGNPDTVHELYGGNTHGSCSLVLISGLYYLVVADRTESLVGVDFCSSSAQLDEFDAAEKRTTFDRLRIDAARAYLHDNKPIDTCFNYGEVRPPPHAPYEKDRCFHLEQGQLDEAR